MINLRCVVNYWWGTFMRSRFELPEVNEKIKSGHEEHLKNLNRMKPYEKVKIDNRIVFRPIEG